ncbi:hypothetical protein A0H81_10704 [Grifola frondosa]|uniref:Uncharacterized protein n=1 Tax=Grifola frondosa TaxID=5627 RepID=A0A1C7LYK1_GRIFR|nr:hypothetical protein A0H81_10704 [Grifola frondosa]
MEDLSEEEDELEELNLEIKNRGFNFLVPIGRTFTQHEEKNDASEVSESESAHSGEAPSMMDEGENDESSEEDLDADMEDFDEEAGDTTGATGDVDTEGEGSDDSEEDSSE